FPPATPGRRAGTDDERQAAAALPGFRFFLTMTAAYTWGLKLDSGGGLGLLQPVLDHQPENVTFGDNAGERPMTVHDRQAADSVLGHELCRFTEGVVGRNRYRPGSHDLVNLQLAEQVVDLPDVQRRSARRLGATDVAQGDDAHQLPL